MDNTEKFRTRWLRWLGQKTRCDKDNWVTLLQDWTMWADKVLKSKGIDDVYLTQALRTREEVKAYFARAIQCADMKDLMALDELYCAEKIE